MEGLVARRRVVRVRRVLVLLGLVLRLRLVRLQLCQFFHVFELVAVAQPVMKIVPELAKNVHVVTSAAMLRAVLTRGVPVFELDALALRGELLALCDAIKVPALHILASKSAVCRAESADVGPSHIELALRLSTVRYACLVVTSVGPVLVGARHARLLWLDQSVHRAQGPVFLSGFEVLHRRALVAVFGAGGAEFFFGPLHEVAWV